MRTRLSRRHFLTAAGTALTIAPLRHSPAQGPPLTYRCREFIGLKGWYLPPPPYSFLDVPEGLAESHIASEVQLGRTVPVCPEETIPQSSPASRAYKMRRRCFRSGDRVPSTVLHIRHLDASGSAARRFWSNYRSQIGRWKGQSSGQSLDLSGAALLHRNYVSSTSRKRTLVQWWLDYPGQPTGSWVRVTAQHYPPSPYFWYQIQACKWGVESLDGFVDDEEVVLT